MLSAPDKSNQTDLVLNTRVQTNINGIWPSVLGCMAGIAAFFFWASLGTQWHPDQTIADKLMRLNVALTVAYWVSSIIVLFVIAAVLTRTQTLTTAILIATCALILVTFLLVHTTPYTPRGCTKSIIGTYECDDSDLVFKALVMLFSLGFPVIFGLQLRSVSFCRLINWLRLFRTTSSTSK